MNICDREKYSDLRMKLSTIDLYFQNLEIFEIDLYKDSIDIEVLFSEGFERNFVDKTQFFFPF